MKVGDVVWVKKTDNFWFAEVKIVAETTRSWVWVTHSLTATYVAEPWYVEQYGKKLPKNLKGYIVADAGAAKLHNWAISERYNIGDAVRRSTDPAILLAVSKLVGFKQPEGL